MYKPVEDLQRLLKDVGELPVLRTVSGIPPNFKPESRGWHVRLLKRVLAARGYGAAAWGRDEQIGDAFDAEVVVAVRKFQQANGLVVDAIVGAQTWHALAYGQKIEPADDFEAIDREGLFRQVVCAMALLLVNLKVREHGGNNRGEVVDAIQRHAAKYVGYPYCVAMCDFLAETGYQHLGGKAPFDIGVSSSKLVEHAVRFGRIVEAEAVKPGDLFVIAGGSTGWQHTGMVYKRLPDGSFQTIEGNTNSAGSSEGDGVYMKTRDPKRTIMRFVDVAPR